MCGWMFVANKEEGVKLVGRPVAVQKKREKKQKTKKGQQNYVILL